MDKCDGARLGPLKGLGTRRKEMLDSFHILFRQKGAALPKKCLGISTRLMGSVVVVKRKGLDLA